MNSIQNPDYRFSFTNRLGQMYVMPLGSDEFTVQWNRQADAKLDYQKTMPNKIVIKDNTDAVTTYKRLLRLERSIYRCEPQNITVERRCTNTGVEIWVPWFSGVFKANECVWDLYKRIVEIKVADDNADECFERVKGLEIDLLFSTNVRRTVEVFYPDISLQLVEYTTTNPADVQFTNVYWGGTGNPSQQGYGYYYWRTARSNGGAVTNTTRWAREIITVPCNQPAPTSEWVIISDQCASLNIRQYARAARSFACELTQPIANTNPQVTMYSCLLVGQNSVIFDNGIPLETALDKFAQQCTGLTIVSNFYQINPDVLTNINYVTGLKSNTRFITIFQKSDVKRPDSNNNATKAVTTLDEILDTSRKFHNTRYRIEAGNILRIEHVSYFSKSFGHNLPLRQAADPKHFTIGGNQLKYSYDTSKIPAREEFKSMEASPGDFEGLPIVYSGGCVTNGNVVTYAVDNVTTDVLLCLNNPEPDSKIVKDEGFVWMAVDFDPATGKYYLLNDAPILSGGDLNNTMSWAHLQRDYHKWERPLSSGNMNGQPTQFFSTIPTKKGDKLSFPLVCGDNFNPDNFITTLLGKAIVEDATFNFKTGRLEFTPLYNADLGLTQNARPVANGDVVTAVIDTPLTISPAVNDTDPDAGDFITAVEVVSQPMNGTALALGLDIIYTPNSGYTGSDLFTYRVLDSWSEPSIPALISITVNASDPAPIAMADNYNGTKNTTLTITAPGVLANDTDNNPLTVQSFTQPANGNNQVNANGSFSYVPNTGFSGNDSFTYTIVDSVGHTATATVTISVIDPDAPMLANDTYSTSRGIDAIIAAPGLLANDTTPIGTLSVTAGTFITVQGGSVTINSDGSFDYKPLLSFIGTDSFTYRASNGTASATATVTINVSDSLFVRLQMLNTTNDSIIGLCNGVQSYLGQFKTADHKVFFYSDQGGTVPVAVTNLNFNYTITSIDQVGNVTTQNFSVVVSGTDYQINMGYEYYRDQYNCANVLIAYTNQHFSAIAGNYTII